MSERAFFITGGQIRHVANAAGAAPQYRAACRVVPPGEAIASRCDDRSETIIAVVRGAIELMVNGAAGLLAAGDFARIPPRVPYAYRSAAHETTELLVRVAPATTPRPTCRVTIDIAAA